MRAPYRTGLIPDNRVIWRAAKSFEHPMVAVFGLEPKPQSSKLRQLPLLEYREEQERT